MLEKVIIDDEFWDKLLLGSPWQCGNIDQVCVCQCLTKNKKAGSLDELYKGKKFWQRRSMKFN